MTGSRRWEGQTVVCIASGPSLTVEDCDAVKRAELPSIAVNSSWKAAPWCDVLYAGDLAWWRAYGHEVSIPAERWSCSGPAAKLFGTHLHACPGHYNSGQRAVQLALEFGAVRVLLLGYDCSVKDGAHWHGNHDKTANPNNDRAMRWKAQFAELANSSGGRIINCSRRTALDCFPKGDLEDYL